MLRLSRIHAPRATLAAIALLAMAALAFGALADTSARAPGSEAVQHTPAASLATELVRLLGSGS